jgi:DNA-binding PadR family transcriptional regulator
MITMPGPHGPHGPHGSHGPHEQRRKRFFGEDEVVPGPNATPWDETPRPHEHAWDEDPRHHQQAWDEEARPPFPPGFAGPAGPPGPPGAPGFGQFFAPPEPPRPPDPPGRAFTRPGPPFGGWFGRGGGGRPKVGRGDVRAAILLLLFEEPRNGYQIITEIEQRSNGVWRPSPGSVYPALNQLEDEGLVQTDQSSGRKLFQLTDAGRSHIEEQDIQPPWDAIAGTVDDDLSELHSIIGQVTMAAMQVARVGSDISRARRILIDARKQLYRILAEDDESEE